MSNLDESWPTPSDCALHYSAEQRDAFLALLICIQRMGIPVPPDMRRLLLERTVVVWVSVPTFCENLF